MINKGTPHKVRFLLLFHRILLLLNDILLTYTIIINTMCLCVCAHCIIISVTRNKMLNDIIQLCTFHISGDLLLYGAVELDNATNCKLFDAVHDYIEETGRL